MAYLVRIYGIKTSLDKASECSCAQNRLHHQAQLHIWMQQCVCNNSKGAMALQQALCPLFCQLRQTINANSWKPLWSVLICKQDLMHTPFPVALYVNALLGDRSLRYSPLEAQFLRENFLEIWYTMDLNRTDKKEQLCLSLQSEAYWGTVRSLAPFVGVLLWLPKEKENS